MTKPNKTSSKKEPLADDTLRVYHRAFPLHSLTQTARALGRSHGAIARKAKRLGLTFTNKSGQKGDETRADPGRRNTYMLPDLDR